jgi:hypothetical protein
MVRDSLLIAVSSVLARSADGRASGDVFPAEPFADPYRNCRKEGIVHLVLIGLPSVVSQPSALLGARGSTQMFNQSL